MIEDDGVEEIQILSNPAVKKNSTFNPFCANQNEINKTSKKDELIKLNSQIPLSERLRPNSFDAFFGQEEIVGDNGILKKLIETDRIPSMIFWGPPGSGKTSLARILALKTSAKFQEISATSEKLSDVRKFINDLQKIPQKQTLLKSPTTKRTILFVDEIHRFNKMQQDVFLPFVESGKIILIGATTENPSFRLNPALLSRCRTFIFHKIDKLSLSKIIKSALDAKLKDLTDSSSNQTNFIVDQDVVEYICKVADGDARSAINIVEIALNSLTITDKSDSDSRLDSSLPSQDITPAVSLEKSDIQSIDNCSRVDDKITVDLSDEPSKTAEKGKEFRISVELINTSLQKSHIVYNVEEHYDLISAFHKSLRGSSENGALYWLARMIKGGEDPLYIARRMVRFASEDIGIVNSEALQIAVSTMTACSQIGYPECDVILAHCAVYLAKSKKNVDVYRAIKKAKSVVDDMDCFPVPLHLRNAPTNLMVELGYSKGYMYNPDYEEGTVDQKYLPDELEDYKFI
ncbi:ATPase WRNIP1 [Smittium culicis]|uniref:ATPase WRNIP1 n=1 Tax=Smittium culicis TaxID=133412 RepID=A0A1R1WZ58_9FUNG|nr:ATPase WRNIP1 [Smittium culicis]